MQWPAWLNRTVIGAGIASFFGDLGYESVTVLLPSFLILLGAPVYALGIIEGLSDGASSFVKLFSGYFADKLGRRREFAFGGSVATAVFPAIIAVASSWYVVLAGRLVGWIGKGIRSPSRDAILSKSVEKKDLGKAFGFHRAGDTLGAIAGPALALVLVASMGIRELLWLAVIPGFLALIAIWLFLRERDPTPHPQPRPLIASLRGLPSRFKSFLTAVLVFGIADFSHTLLIAFAIVSLTPSLGFTTATAAGAGLYLIRNIVYAASSYPFGSLGDRIGRRPMLVLGYAIAVATFIGFVIAPANVVAYGCLFAMCGLFIAAEDTLEGALAGEMVEEESRALGFGALATTNGVGDLVSSVMIGFIWAFIGYSAGFIVAAVIGAAGTLLLIWTTRRPHGARWSPV
ncbi:MAG: MFS transporter [Methanoregula sp.]|jgi:MFS family permease|uniref:MFS transporter n=1 Tax=Methanoregula sp. TaxID=2052170 RepID=UPI003C232210